MSIRDQILEHLAKGPATSSEILRALPELSPMQISSNCSALKTEGRLDRDDETKRWSLVTGQGDREGTVERLPAPQRRVRHVAPKRAKAEPSLGDQLAEMLQNQVDWAQNALDLYVERQGDPTVKVLVDNLIAAKAAQLALQAEG